MHILGISLGSKQGQLGPKLCGMTRRVVFFGVHGLWGGRMLSLPSEKAMSPAWWQASPEWWCGHSFTCVVKASPARWCNAWLPMWCLAMPAWCCVNSPAWWKHHLRGDAMHGYLRGGWQCLCGVAWNHLRGESSISNLMQCMATYVVAGNACVALCHFTCVVKASPAWWWDHLRGVWIHLLKGSGFYN